MALHLIDLINFSDQLLDHAGVEAPRQNVERMLEKVMSLKRIELYLNPKREVTVSEEAEFKNMLDRRLASEPLQYILGETEFYGIKYKCDRRALIPRPETEFVVQSALKYIDRHRGLRILDLGCGCGAIVVAVAVKNPDQDYFASDVSTDAIELARENASLNDISDKIEFRTGSMLSPFKNDDLKFNLVLSNPPYIKSGEFELLHEQIKRFEPRRALLAGPDGLEFIRQMISEASEHLQTDGFLIFEVGLGQAELIREFISSRSAFEYVESVVDYRGVKRVVVLRKV
ncbi:MAG: peptide chain release factor N(5)-glutamine methyltransferase [candidate division Zixibacteria bacterium]|nr:peptide chain release factor N(5)-glutamine methyltransferase [candidate division Zixibacteria bacterium]